MLSPSQLQTLLNQFQSRYPMGCLCAELLTVHQDQFVVRALVQVAGTTLATAMAAAPEIEAAEDRAKIRALEAVGLGNGATAFAQPVSNSLLGNLTLETSQPQKSGASNSTQLEDPNLLKAKLASPPDPSFNPDQSFNKEPKLTEKSISVASSLGSVNQLTSSDAKPDAKSTDPMARLNHSEQPALTNPAIASSIYPLATDTENEFAETNFAKADFAVNEEIEVSAEPKTAVSATRAPKAEKPSKRKTEAFELPPVPASQNPSDRSEEIMKIGIEMKRLGWSTEQGREYLKRTYGKRSRQELDDAELLDFLHYLEGQPSPLQTPF